MKKVQGLSQPIVLFKKIYETELMPWWCSVSQVSAAAASAELASGSTKRESSTPGAFAFYFPLFLKFLLALKHNTCERAPALE